MIARLLRVLLVVPCFLAFTPAWADESPSDPASTPDAAIERAQAAANAARIDGPTAIPLGDQAVLNLPADFAFIPRREAADLMQAVGNSTGPNFYGMVVGSGMNGFVTVEYEPAGYVKDDEAKDWNADDLLQNLKDGTEAANEDRRARGIPEFSVTGWVEKPSYDAATHRLVWSAEIRDKQPTADSMAGVNYNTYLLGRDGYISMDLVTDLDSVEQEKPYAKQLLAALDFNEGKRYADFNSSTDKVAEYGLAALVGGIAVKKLGLLALAGAFFAKFAKLIILGTVGVLAAVKKFFGGKKET